MRYVVDTNVPIVANGRDTNASLQCRIKCIEFIEEMMHSGRLLVDIEGEIEAEYRIHLNFGQPGVGNRFIQAFFSTAASRIERIEIGAKQRNGDYADFPKDRAMKNFDRSDRKFVAVAIKGKAPIANAVDSDWLEHHSSLARNKVSIKFLCGTDRREW